jgi:hypothetical protein
MQIFNGLFYTVYMCNHAWSSVIKQKTYLMVLSITPNYRKNAFVCTFLWNISNAVQYYEMTTEQITSVLANDKYNYIMI